MQIVIEISEEQYNALCMKGVIVLESQLPSFLKALRNGTILPKGHGKIGDLTAVMDDINRSIDEMTKLGIMVDADYLWSKLTDAIDNAPTIIPADKKNS